MLSFMVLHLEELCFFFLCQALFFKHLKCTLECSILSQTQLCYKNVKVIACSDQGIRDTI